MNAEQLKAAGFSEQEVGEYIKLQSAGFSDSEISEYYSKKEDPAPQRSYLSRLVGNILPDAWQAIQGPWVSSEADLKAKMEQLKNPSPLATLRANPLVGAIRDPLGVPGRVAEEVAEHPVQSAMTLAPLANKPIRAMARRVGESTIPERILGSAIPIDYDPLTAKTKGPQAAIDERIEILHQGVVDRQRRSEAGWVKAAELEKESQRKVDDVINRAMRKGEDKVNLKELVDTGLKTAYDLAENSSDRLGAREIINRFRDKFLDVDKESGLPRRTEVTIEQANAIKRQMYNEIRWSTKTPTGLSAQLMEAEKKGAAHQIMAELERRHPELKQLNADDAVRIRLRDAVQKAVEEHRSGPHAVVGIHRNGIGLGLYAWQSTLGHPWIKESLAFALDKVRGVAKDVARTPKVEPLEMSYTARGIPRYYLPQSTSGALPSVPGPKGLLPEPKPGDFTMPGYPMRSGRLLEQGRTTEVFDRQRMEEGVQPLREPRQIPSSTGPGGLEVIQQHLSPLERLMQIRSKPPALRNSEERLFEQQMMRGKIKPPMSVLPPETPVGSIEKDIAAAITEESTKYKGRRVE